MGLGKRRYLSRVFKGLASDRSIKAKFKDRYFKTKIISEIKA